MRRATIHLLLLLALVAPALGWFAAAGNGVPETCFAQTATIDDHRGRIDGTPGEDVLIGNANGVGSDTVLGGDGDDKLAGFDGSDHLDGGPGDDKISAREFDFPLLPGVDVVQGGLGNDTIQAADEVRDLIDCGPGDDTAVVDAGLDVVFGCERLKPPGS
jgi:Ca2+-binding RTX toxin-like protein